MTLRCDGLESDWNQAQGPQVTEQLRSSCTIERSGSAGAVLRPCRSSWDCGADVHESDQLKRLLVIDQHRSTFAELSPEIKSCSQPLS